MINFAPPKSDAFFSSNERKYGKFLGKAEKGCVPIFFSPNRAVWEKITKGRAGIRRHKQSREYGSIQGETKMRY